GTITDDDGESLSIDDVTVTEANTTATFTVTLSASSSQTVSVDYATADNDAAAGSDYTAASGTLTFDPGVTTQTIDVTVLEDGTSEATETYFVDLTSPTNASISDGQGLGTINDEDTDNVTYPSGNDGNNPGGGDNIEGVARSGGGDDSNNLVSGKPRVDVDFVFSGVLADTEGDPQQELELFIAHESSPSGDTDPGFFKYAMDCSTGEWATGKTCDTTLRLGPAAACKFFFKATKNDGTVVRLPASCRGVQVLLQGYKERRHGCKAPCKRVYRLPHGAGADKLPDGVCGKEYRQPEHGWYSGL
ncbi:MAG: Calx-beta domain-containing protein, partial [Planctomycetota bacterium]